MRFAAVALCALLLATSCGPLGRLLPCSERRHSSGITIVCHEEVVLWRDASEELKRTASFALELAMAYPNSFGYPAPDFNKREVVLRVVRSDGDALARTWMATGIDLPAPAGKQVRSLPRPMVPVRFEGTARSVAQLERIKDDVGPNLKELPDSNAIYQSGSDLARNATRFVIERESDALLRALAKRYGTEALVIEINPDRPHPTDLTSATRPGRPRSSRP